MIRVFFHEERSEGSKRDNDDRYAGFGREPEHVPQIIILTIAKLAAHGSEDVCQDYEDAEAQSRGQSKFSLDTDLHSP